MATLIIDAGSTKTEWCVAADGKVLHRFVSIGINPNYHEDSDIVANVESFVSDCPKGIYDEIESILYYGAGCAADANKARMTTLLRRSVPAAHITVDSDLMGACRALCGSQSGIAAILGTGAAACLYDGTRIVSRAPSLGYMLGDEGSGTHLGKMFLTDYLLGKFPQEIAADFEKEFAIDTAALIRKIYREPAPNRFMASLAPFIAARLPHPAIHSFCKSCFNTFFKNQIHYFAEYQKYTLNIIGSVGFHFQEVIRECAAENNVTTGLINASPMPALVRQTKKHIIQ